MNGNKYNVAETASHGILHIECTPAYCRHGTIPDAGRSAIIAGIKSTNVLPVDTTTSIIER